MTHYALTTIDNRFDPFTEWSQWLNEDEFVLRHHSSGLLARVAHVSDELSDAEYQEELSRAIDDIIKHDELDIFRKVSRDFED